jgi:hypothetical protein
MPFGGTGEPRRAPVGDDLRLHVIKIGRDQPNASRANTLEDLTKGEHGGAGGDIGPLGNVLAKALIIIESEPTRRRAIPGDDIDLGVRKQFPFGLAGLGCRP